MPGLSWEYANAVLGVLDDRSRADAEQHLLECLRMLVLSDVCLLVVETSRELETVRDALAARTTEYAGLRDAIARGGGGRSRCSCTGGAGCGVSGGSGGGEHLHVRGVAGVEPIRCAAAYVQTFGPFTLRTVRLWPDAQVVMGELGAGLSGLNDAAAGWAGERAVSSPSPWRRWGEVSRLSEL
jgi:hypothetical protein